MYVTEKLCYGILRVDFRMLWDSKVGWVLCPNRECNSTVTIKLFDPELLNPKTLNPKAQSP